MFSVKEKQYIASQVEKLLLSLEHPEMPKEKPVFHLHVEGNSEFSWADIKPNHTFTIENPPQVNAWNEISRSVLESKNEEKTK